MPSECEALSSNPSTATKKKKKKTERTTMPTIFPDYTIDIGLA
jgi:hypothetical protein